jgi:altronate hydrolase
MPEKKVLQIHPADNVWVALTDLEAGDVVTLNETSITVHEQVPAKHKIFTHALQQQDTVIMYGVTVGRISTESVAGGERMRTDNIHHAVDDYAYRTSTYTWQPPDISRFKDRVFYGYPRKDGRTGTANYWLFIPTVFCENRNMDTIKDALQYSLGYASGDQYRQYTQALIKAYQQGEDWKQTGLALQATAHKERIFANIDGIKFLNHEGGCGGTRGDAATLGKLLAAYADHPNVAGVTILSLGCQHLQVAHLQQYIQERNPDFDKPLLVFEQQLMQSEEALIRDAIRQTFEQLIVVNRQQRVATPLSQLCLGVKCGGSDGFSGISANPAVGYAADILVALGGTVLLAEFPELCGIEQELIDRCTNRDHAEKFIHLMKSYDALAHAVGSGFFMNPSPGNIKDGLITDAIKSAGACKKGGTSPVTDVLDYTEKATKPGLNLVCTPGNDVEATTGKTASGATLILFTTGLGTPTGNPICPVIKVSSNTVLAKKMSDIIDINAGEVIDGTKSIEAMGEAILDYCIEVANGNIIPKAVQLNQDDFIPWKKGVSL